MLRPKKNQNIKKQAEPIKTEHCSVPPRENALELLKQHVKDPANINHSLEAEVVMRGLAKNLGEDEELWGITGLLHDLDWEETGEENPKEHGVKCLEYLADYPEELKQAIQAHNYNDNNTQEPSTKLDYALRAGETVTGLIYACALVRPDKKLASVKVKSLKKKMKDKSFAAKVNRDTIKECEKLGLEVDEFLQISLESMQSIADEIGL